MISNHINPGLKIVFFVALVALLSVSARPQQNAVLKVLRNGEVQRVLVPHINPQALLANQERYAAVRRGDVLNRVQPAASITHIAALGAFELPETYWTRERGTGAVMELRPVIVIDAPVRLDPTTQVFRGGVNVFLEEVGSTVQRNLTDPLQVLVSARADDFGPKTLSLDHTFLPLEAVQVVSGNPGDSIEIRFITAANATGYIAQVPVEPSLTIHTGQTRLQAFGVEKTSLLITRQPVSAKASPAVGVTATRGYVSPGEIDLASGQASVSVRSGSVGSSLVSVVGPGYRTVQTELAFVWPWPFLIATLVGSGLGTFYWVLLKKNSKYRSIVRRLIYGFLVVAAWAIAGLNLLNFAMPPYYNEGLAFILGGLASSGVVIPKPTKKDTE